MQRDLYEVIYLTNRVEPLRDYKDSTTMKYFYVDCVFKIQ